MSFLTPTYPTSYCSFVWGHNFSTIQQLLILQKKRFINFQPRNLRTSPLLKESFIFKFQDKICLGNTLFLSKSLNNLTPSVFNTWFGFSSDQQNCENSISSQGNLIKLFYNSNSCGKYSITVSAVESWNKIQKQLKNMLLKDLCLNEIKTVYSNFYLKSYW